MKEKIKNLIKLSQQELKEVSKEDEKVVLHLAIYWATRVQTFREILELIELEENETIH